MENKEIMQRLLQEDSSSNFNGSNDVAIRKNGKDWDVSMSRIRVVTAKYKVYIVLLAIFIFLLAIVYIPNTQDDYKLHNDIYQQTNSQLTSINKDIDDAKADFKYLFDIVKNEWTVKNCLNSSKECWNLPEWWVDSWNRSQLSSLVPLSYLQMHSLYNSKMPVDEKAVLKNLNEYLIKQNITWNDRWRVGEILRIEIWDPEYVNWWDEHFLQVPVNVEIEFTTVDDLIGFLYNVEKRIIESSEDRILYKIQSVSYDVVSKDEPQVTDISMIAYYYHDEKFNNVDENTAILESKGDSSHITESSESKKEDINENSKENSNKINDSDSIFENIYGKIKNSF